MMFRCVVAPVALAWAKRTLSDSPSVSPANSCQVSTLSDQELSAFVARAATSGSTEVCFKVQKSLKYSQSTGQHSVGKLRSGEFECVQLKDHIQTTEKALASLVDGEVVKLRRSSEWVVCAVERNGYRVRDVTLNRPVSVMKVGREVSRTVVGTQEMTAKYKGSVKPADALLLVASGVESSTEDLACFRIRTAQDYAMSPSSDTAVGQLQNNEKICVRLEDLSPEATTIIDGLEMEDSVDLKLAHEKVVTEWRNIDHSTDSVTEFDITVTLRKRAKNIVQE